MEGGIKNRFVVALTLQATHTTLIRENLRGWVLDMEVPVDSFLTHKHWLCYKKAWESKTGSWTFIGHEWASQQAKSMSLGSHPPIAYTHSDTKTGQAPQSPLLSFPSGSWPTPKKPGQRPWLLSTVSLAQLSGPAPWWFWYGHNGRPLRNQGERGSAHLQVPPRIPGEQASSLLCTHIPTGVWVSVTHL